MLLDVYSPRRQHDSMRRKIGQLAFYQGITAIMLVGGLLMFKWGLREFHDYVIPGRTGFDTDLAAKPKWFLQVILTDALNLWNIDATWWIAALVSIVLLGGLLLYFGGNWRWRLFNVLVCAVALPVAHLPNILAERSDSYRTQVGLSWSILVLLLLAATGLWRAGLRLRNAVSIDCLPRGLMIGGAAAAMMSAAYTSTMFIAWPHALELAVLRIQLAQPNVSTAHHLIFLQLMTWGDSPAPYWVSDEFGCPSIANAFDWEPRGAVYLIDRESDRHAEHRDIKIVPFFTGAYTEALPPDTAVVDMRRMYAAR